ncbi:MAG: ferritin family protein [Polyangiales bacterium]
MDKTRLIDFATLTLRDALDLATLVEEEAKERYGEFADQMDAHHNPEAATFFRFMLKVETIHEGKLATRRMSLFGDAPRNVRREMIFDIEAPEYDEVNASMTVRHALQASLRAEQKAHAFFEAALARVTDPEARVLFVELRDEEFEHQRLVEKELAKLPPDAPISGDAFADDPVAL